MSAQPEAASSSHSSTVSSTSSRSRILQKMGTATAASLWSTGVIGAAVGFGLYDIGLVLSLINLATLRLLAPPTLRWLAMLERVLAMPAERLLASPSRADEPPAARCKSRSARGALLLAVVGSNLLIIMCCMARRA